MSTDLKIAILYSDAKREYFPTEDQYISEYECKERAEMIAHNLSAMKITAATFPGDDQLTVNLKKFSPNFAINLVDSVYGQEYLQATIPAILELLKIPYTGTAMMGLTITTNKYFNKNLLEQYGLTTPKYQLITNPTDVIDPALDFPLIAKLNEVHGSLEIQENSISDNEKDLRSKISSLMNTYHQPVLIEEYVAGREVTAIVLEGANTKVYAAEKIFNPEKFKQKYQIVTFDDNFRDPDNLAYSYQKYELPPRAQLQVKKAFEILKMDDYAKFDLRVDASGRHYFIDCNANPAIGPKDCAISNILKLYDISFEEILKRIIKNTLNGQAADFKELA